MEGKEALAAEQARNEKEIQQLENRQKILLNRIRLEERRARNHRLIEHGAILEGVFPTVIGMEGEAIKAFLIALSHLPGARELTEKARKAGETK